MKKIIVYTIIITSIIIVFLIKNLISENQAILDEIVSQRQKFLCEKNKGELGVFVWRDKEKIVYCVIGEEIYRWNGNAFFKNFLE